jgi:multidrug efflux system membrane fusion protein
MRPVCSLLLALAACSSEGAAAREGEKAVPVRVRGVEVAPLVRPVHATGRLGYGDEVRLAFKIGGVVASIDVKEGDRVARGQMLARLDPREIDAALAQARSAQTKARRDLKRARRLHAGDAVSGEALQNAVTAAQVTGATAAAVEFNRRTSEIRAPVDGVVLARRAEPGEVVAAGAPVLVVGAVAPGAPVQPEGEVWPAGSAGPDGIGPPGGRVARVGVADRDVGRIGVGDRAVVELDALPGRSLAGRVGEVAPSASPATGLVEVEIDLEAPESAALASGLVLRATIEPEPNEVHQVVPMSALVEADGSRAFVYAVTPDRRRAVKRAVAIAFLAGDRAAIASGLDGVIEVVTQGAAYLHGDRAIHIVTDPVPSAVPLGGPR